MGKRTEHKESEATVKIYYKVGKTLADGSHPFLVRITKDRKQVFRSTGLSLHPSLWDSEKSNFRDAILVDKAKGFPKEEQKKLVNKLAEWEKKYKGAAETLAETDEQYDTHAVLSKAVEGRKATRRIKLLAYCYELSAGYLKTGQNGNATVYKDLANQLAKFVAVEAGALTPPSGRGKSEELAEWVEKHDIPLDRVSVNFCREWEATLRATGIKEITLSLRFRTLRALLNQAIAAGLLKADSYPFARTVAERHKFTVGKFDISTSKRAISREELRQLEALQPVKERKQLAKDVFLFSFYCGGINFVDLGQLRWKDLAGTAEIGQRLTYVRQKTGGKFSMKLLAPAAAIIAKHRPFTYAGNNSYIFPILDNTKHLTSEQVKNRLHKVLGQVNEDLKELGRLAGIATPLTTYVARHSFATTLRQSGAATAVISQAMGHRSEATTAVYLDSFASEVVDNAFEGLL